VRTPKVFITPDQIQNAVRRLALDKPHRRQVHVPIAYCGFTLPGVFVVGHGLDWSEQYRHLPDICVLEL
jgi:hypoxanthine-guanine phosphoribosyltransferase